MARRRLNQVVLTLLLAAAVLLGARQLLNSGDPERPCNLLLITLDTTRADRLGCYGYTQALTPALDRLAASGVTFDRAHSSVPMTLPSHATMLTGLQPPEHGLRVNGEHRLDLALPTLAEELRAAGYATGAFVAAVVLDSQNGLDRGFETYQDEVAETFKQKTIEPLSAYRPGDIVTDNALAWLEHRDPDQPFFCWVHLFDPHNPYFAHPELAGTRYADQASYDAEVAFMDLQVGRLMSFLEREGLLGTTLIVAAGDHGEGLGDHEEKAHGHRLFEATLRVPLMFSQPGRLLAGHRVDATVSLVDLFGTVLELLEVGELDERSGRSLAAALFGHEITSFSCYSETTLPYTSFRWSPLWSLTTPRWKYIRSARPHLYDLEADPDELTNLAGTRPDLVSQMEQELAQIEEEMIVHQAEGIRLTAEAVKRLEALGYAAGGRTHFDVEKVDYLSLRDVEDMNGVLPRIARSHALARESESAEDYILLLREIIERTPESPIFRIKLASALVKIGRAADALSEATEYVTLKPDDPEAHHCLSIAYAARGNLPEAVRALWRAIRLAPDDGLAHEDLALILQHCSDPRGAARHTSGSWAEHPEAVEQYDLGVVLGARDEFGPAIDHLNEAVRLAPDDALVHSSLANLLSQDGRLDEAVRHYAEAVRLDPAYTQGLYNLGTILGKQGKNEEAAAYLHKFLDAEPRDVPVHSNLGVILGRLGKQEEAMELFREASRLDPDDAQVYVAKGGLLEEQGETKEAVAAYRQAIRLSPDRSDVAKHLAWILATHHDSDVRDGPEAVRLAKLATGRATPQGAGLLDTLAAAYAEVGLFTEAVATARKAAALAEEAGSQQLAHEIRARMELYAMDRAYRSAP